MEKNPEEARGEEQIGRLIAAAGAGPTASTEARARIYAAVRSQWQESVRQQRTAARSALARRNRLFGIAASILVAAAVLYWLLPGGPVDAPTIALARVLRVQGEAQLIREGSASGLEDPAGGVTAGAGEPAGVVAGDILRTGADGRLALDTGDELELRVDVDTELAFVDDRTVELRAGAIYVDSGAATGGPPLDVRTRLGSVTHIGTQYEVRLGDATLRLRVREGSVQFSDPAGARAVGTAGEELEFGADGSSTRSNVAADDAGWAWATSLATLPPAAAYSLGDVLRWLAREQGLELDIGSEDIERRLDAESLVGLDGLTPSETLDVLRRTTDLELNIGGGRLIVTD